ncbi:hypothetical protein VKT23_013660 [Stygiomarasmius scandens]|uniref:Uncharacterized protein n=1 Tax=Marasmiellus scandens TaxID=2682957 RepID=A0ABR1J341_9AGAR
MEFYRCVNKVYSGAVLVDPERSVGTGRIDFVVNERRWGLEFTRNGRDLQEHLDRIAPNRKYISPHIDEHLVVDCHHRIGSVKNTFAKWKGQLLFAHFSDEFDHLQILEADGAKHSETVLMDEELDPLDHFDDDTLYA